MAHGRRWSRDETLVAFRLYCQTPFGKLHRGNPEIIALAARLGRTPSAVGMKACNFASLDPVQRARGIRGLANTSGDEPRLWEEFAANSEVVAAETEAAYERLISRPVGAKRTHHVLPSGPTEDTRTVRTRRVQGFFRGAVLNSYSGRCALTGLSVLALLNASHIIPWSESTVRRADPRNGLCLNALHDRAFDRGLITFDDEGRVVISPAIEDDSELGDLAGILPGYAGRPLVLPERFAPDPEAIRFHRENIFRAT